MTYYAINRSSAAVAHWGHPEITAFTVQAARNEYVRQDSAHRQRAGAGEAARLCRLWYCMSLSDALSGGVV
jgi:hypothetical protein